ncbi:hypothetical protein CCH79_00009881 [Gambusia affinis]|uniref:BHLH domain-containing protein n=1 Tax=Gambusia affinis TaxID=33528 RepID=A0A315V8J1_GAMAF|nr:hypothetical protein CCH79_00009881 [Gambusia affinis]
MAAIGMVQMLIEAAEYLDRREREAEHGYASMPPFISSRERESLKRKNKSKKNISSRGVGGKGKQHRNQGGRKHLPEPKIQPEYVGSLRCQICYVTRGCLPCAGMHTVLEGGGGRPGEKRSTPEWLPET